MSVPVWAISKEFTTLSDALDGAKQHQEWGRRYAEADHGDGVWSGGTYAQCEQWVRYGWPEGAAEASEKARRAVDRVVGQTGNALVMQMQNDVCGAVYDVGAYCSGEPECWIRPEPTLAKRAIHICTHAGASASIATSIIRARGIAVAGLALALNAAGYPVTIDVTYTTCRDDGKRAAATVRVADATTGSQLDVDRVVYAMAHPTMLRLIFRALLADKDPGSYWDYGACLTSTPPTDKAYDLFMPGIHYGDYDYKRDPEGWTRREFERLTKAG